MQTLYEAAGGADGAQDVDGVVLLLGSRVGAAHVQVDQCSAHERHDGGDNEKNPSAVHLHPFGPALKVRGPPRRWDVTHSGACRHLTPPTRRFSLGLLEQFVPQVTKTTGARREHGRTAL